MKIVDAGQYVSLEGMDAGQVRCRITVRTDDGRQVSIPTSEETVNQIIELLHGLTPEKSVEPVRPEPTPDFAFGREEVMTSAHCLGSIAEAPTREIEEVIPSLGQARLHAPHVPADEYGYPIVAQRPEPVPDVAEEEDPGEQI
jgi:hypothetical protein